LFFLNSHSWIFFLSRRLFFIKKNLVWHVMIYIFLEFFWLAMRPRLVLAKPKWPVPWEQVWQKGQILADMILYQTSWTDSCVLRLHHVPLSYILLEKALKTQNKSDKSTWAYRKTQHPRHFLSCRHVSTVAHYMDKDLMPLHFPRFFYIICYFFIQSFITIFF
jgi:hypothetical protein